MNRGATMIRKHIRPIHIATLAALITLLNVACVTHRVLLSADRTLDWTGRITVTAADYPWGVVFKAIVCNPPGADSLSIDTTGARWNQSRASCQPSWCPLAAGGGDRCAGREIRFDFRRISCESSELNDFSHDESLDIDLLRLPIVNAVNHDTVVVDYYGLQRPPSLDAPTYRGIVGALPMTWPSRYGDWPDNLPPLRRLHRYPLRPRPSRSKQSSTARH